MDLGNRYSRSPEWEQHGMIENGEKPYNPSTGIEGRLWGWPAVGRSEDLILSDMESSSGFLD